MAYSELMVAPMRRDLTRLGIRELRTAEEVDACREEAREGTARSVGNSVCGCSAGSMRPAVAMALANPRRPTRNATVFAGQDVEATARAREYFTGYPPSSPSIALFRDGHLVFMLERHQIKGRMPEDVARDLVAAFDAHCTD